jgi:CubicO group peptidase (beta-lactamase class C family)
MSIYTRRAFLDSAARMCAGSTLAANLPVFAGQSASHDPAMTGAHRAELGPFDELMTSFVKEQHVPGAALAVTKEGRLVYARGFGGADREGHQTVAPNALFRIASISKPITAAAVLHLVENNRVGLDDTVWHLLKLAESADARWKNVTLLHLLQHTGGWDRDVSFDPMFRYRRIAEALKVSLPIEPQHIIQFMLTQPLDFDPGTRYAYSNFGYCLLGRVIEHVTGSTYEHYVQKHVLRLVGIGRMRLGKTPLAERAHGEVMYYDERDREGPAVVGNIGAAVPLPYGAWSLEVMDAHGAWLASAVDLVRFASAFDEPGKCPILRADSVEKMFAHPQGLAGYQADGSPHPAYYACGWNVRPIGSKGRRNTWHAGALDGTSTLLVRRHDRTNWAVLFNTRNGPNGKSLSGQIDSLVHKAADQVTTWPKLDLFDQLL